MTSVIILRQARKDRDRAEKRAKADANATKFGRTKVQKAKEKSDADRAAKHLDGVKRDD
ncbi:DUF4169 family protein [Paracoccus sp. S1E-3]|uniref:DUF4169 family protein n=1 Tax=Paracoccus sp. S1E-3 TaxID=2756130 RepID=UPI0015EF5E94|nr:DUF4169 family protein [Paracoccus sp. S1E-3]MBA4490225.1 DUF4169 family protein [Paracoccus sp. S1E-3]